MGPLDTWYCPDCSPPSRFFSNIVDLGGNFPIEEDAMHRINKTQHLEYAVKFPEETGGGYVAGLEMFHQMHCVVS